MLKQKIAIIFGALLIIGIGVGAIWFNMSLSTNLETLNFIANRYRGGGVFIDYDESIGVTSSKDIGYWRKGDNWNLQYGKLGIELTHKDLQNKEILTALANCGIDVRGNLDENDLRWYWCGEELEEWVSH